MKLDQSVGWVITLWYVGPCSVCRRWCAFCSRPWALEFHADLFPQWWEVFDLYGWQGIVPESAADRALWSKFDKLCRSRDKNIVVATCRRQFTSIKPIALKIFQERPERERESDGACSSASSGSDGASSGSDGVSASDSASKLGRGLNRRCWDAAMMQADWSMALSPMARPCTHGTQPRATLPAMSNALSRS